VRYSTHYLQFCERRQSGGGGAVKAREVAGDSAGKSDAECCEGSEQITSLSVLVKGLFHSDEYWISFHLLLYLNLQLVQYSM
jgi:hypothetical protein